MDDISVVPVNIDNGNMIANFCIDDVCIEMNHYDTGVFGNSLRKARKLINGDEELRSFDESFSTRGKGTICSELFIGMTGHDLVVTIFDKELKTASTVVQDVSALISLLKSVGKQIRKNNVMQRDLEGMRRLIDGGHFRCDYHE